MILHSFARVLQSAGDKAAIEMNGESFIKSTTPSKRSVACVLRGLLKRALNYSEVP